MGDRCHFAHGDSELRTFNDVIIFPISLLFYLADPLRENRARTAAGITNLEV